MPKGVSRISGSGIRQVEYGRGVDAFQALTMALEGIRHVLDRLDTPLVWGDVFGDHSGFQRVIPLLPEPAGVAQGIRRMERSSTRVESEIGREGEKNAPTTGSTAPPSRRYRGRASAKFRH